MVIGSVGLLVSATLATLAMLSTDTGFSVAAMLAAALLAVGIGLFLSLQGWVWSQRAWRRGWLGRSLLIAVGGGVTLILAAAALAGATILVLLFNGT